WRRRDGDASTARTCCRSSAPASLSWTASSRRARSTGRKRKRRDHSTSTSITYLAIDHRLPQVLQQRPRVLQVARVEAFGEPGVERGEERAGRVALALALPEPRQAGGGAQLERLGLLPPGDLQGVAEERLRLLGAVWCAGIVPPRGPGSPALSIPGARRLRLRRDAPLPSKAPPQ